MIGFKMKFLFILFSICIFFNINVWGTDTSVPLQALKNKEYEKSLKLYQEIEKQGYQSGDMYQNMSVAAMSLNKDINAIIYAEKALKFKPGNKDLSEMLSTILKRNSKIESEDSKSAVSNFFNQFIGIFSTSTWIILSLICLSVFCWLIFLGFPDQIFARFNKAKLGISLTLFILFSIFAGFRNYQIYNQNTIIITSDQAMLKVSSDSESPDLSTLVPGSKVYYKDQIKDWWNVVTIYGDEGWIKSTDGQRL